ncbi:MAG: hypothetical protein ACREND_11775 [Gemmatimonadaceae bacterium]
MSDQSLPNSADARPKPAILLAIPFLLAIGLVVYAQGSFSGFAVWNAVPVGLGFAVILVGRRFTRAVRVAGVVFAAVAALLVVLFHLAWLFDWGGTATRSSTSALAFIVVPFWACILAGVAGVVAWGLGRTVFNSRV